jgi:hypothetical protein
MVLLLVAWSLLLAGPVSARSSILSTPSTSFVSQSPLLSRSSSLDTLLALRGGEAIKKGKGGKMKVIDPIVLLC